MYLLLILTLLWIHHHGRSRALLSGDHALAHLLIALSILFFAYQLLGRHSVPVDNTQVPSLVYPSGIYDLSQIREDGVASGRRRSALELRGLVVVLRLLGKLKSRGVLLMVEIVMGREEDVCCTVSTLVNLIALT